MPIEANHGHVYQWNEGLHNHFEPPPSPNLQTNIGGQESQESVIDLTIDTEPCVSRLLDFLYRCDYDALALGDESGNTNVDDSDANNDNINLEEATDNYGNYYDAWDAGSIARANSELEANKETRMSRTSRNLSLHVDMYVLADKYDIASLGDLAKKKFEELANEHNGDSNRIPVLDMIPRIYAVTGGHNRGLRNSVVEYARVERTKTDTFRDQMESLFESVPEFAVDISRSWLEMPYLGYCKGDCGKIMRPTNITCGSCRNFEKNKPGKHGRAVSRAWSIGE